jgi:hypothetical protein
VAEPLLFGKNPAEKTEVNPSGKSYSQKLFAKTCRQIFQNRTLF